MKNYLGVALTVGILAGLWAQFSPVLGLVTWVGFVAWAAYFASGGTARGLGSTLVTTASGAAYGWLVVTVTPAIPAAGAVAVGVGIIAALMCLQAGWAVLGFIPGAFLGASSFFGNPEGIWSTLLALVVGACLGWLSDVTGKLVQSKIGTSAATVEPATPVETAAR
ncbi:DUF1097 domain-containing protein [Salinibacterium sp. PAMC 21357]|uniref:DUF1097 domain-containing protein n=1 Tax=Salinibacterium sp. PAMC 21357 TaxID=1112215 RepID=UPI000289BB9D|nr:DUF1097 domain-containing protein [Salinibacterium sp. PAMC 21357]